MDVNLDRHDINLTSMTFWRYITVFRAMSQSALNKGQEKVSCNGRLFSSCVSQNVLHLHLK